MFVTLQCWPLPCFSVLLKHSDLSCYSEPARGQLSEGQYNYYPICKVNTQLSRVNHISFAVEV